MSGFVPSRGWSVVRSGVFAADAFARLGPFAEGTIIRRLRCDWWLDGGGWLAFGAALGASSEASAAAFQAGQSLVDVSDYAGFGQPLVRFSCTAAQGGFVIIPVGRRVDTGANYVVTLTRDWNVGVETTMVLSAEVVVGRAVSE